MRWLCDTRLSEGVGRIFSCNDDDHYQTGIALKEVAELSSPFSNLRPKLLNIALFANAEDFIELITLVTEDKSLLFSSVFYGGPAYRIANFMPESQTAIQIPDNLTIQATENITYYKQLNSLSTYIVILGDDYNGATDNSIPVINLLKKHHNVLQLDFRRLTDTPVLEFIKNSLLEIKDDVKNLNIEGIYINGHGRNIKKQSGHNTHVIKIDMIQESIETQNLVQEIVAALEIDTPINLILRSCHSGMAIEELMGVLPRDSILFTHARKTEISYAKTESTIGQHFEYHDHFILDYLLQNDYVGSIPYVANTSKLDLGNLWQLANLLLQKIKFTEQMQNDIVEKLSTFPDANLIKETLATLIKNHSFFKKEPEIFSYYDISTQNTALAIMYYTYRFHTDYLHEQFVMDRQVALKAIARNAIAFVHLDKSIQTDLEFIQQALKTNGKLLEFLPHRVQSDSHLTLKALEHNVEALQYISTELQNDPIMVWEAISQDGSQLKFVNKIWQNNERILLRALKTYPKALQYADEMIRDNLVLAKKAVEVNGLALCDLSARLQSTKEIIYKAVEQNGEAIQCAAESYQNNKELALIAIARNHKAFKLLPEKFRDDEELALQVISLDPWLYKYIGNTLKSNRSVALKALTTDPSVFRIMDSFSRGDKELITAIIKDSNEHAFSKHDPALYYKYLDPTVLKDADFILQNNFPIEYVAFPLLDDTEFIIKAIELKEDKFSSVDIDINGQKKSLLHTSKNEILSNASDRLKDDSEFMLKILNMGDYGRYHIGDQLRNNAAFMFKAMTINNDNLYVLGEELRDNLEFMIDVSIFNQDNARIASISVKNEEECKPYYVAYLTERYAKIILNQSLMRNECDLPLHMDYLAIEEELYNIMPLGEEPEKFIMCLADNFRKWADPILDCERLIPNVDDHLQLSESGLCPTPYELELYIARDIQCVCPL